MRIRLYTFWERLSGSFWFIPALMVIAAFVLALVMISVDQSQRQIADTPFLEWIYAGSPDGARSLLSTLAGSMISVAGVTFSITIATLSLASSQLGPRLLNTFMRDRGNQIVLGTFVAIFTYCLLVLRSIRSEEEFLFVPHFSVSLAIVLAIISLGVLIFFFHHVSTIIQAQHVVASIGQELSDSIDRLFSTQDEPNTYEYELRGENDIPDDFEDNNDYILALESGFLQAIDYEELRDIAKEHDLILMLVYRPGDFIAKGNEIIGVYPTDSLTEDLEETIFETFTIGAERLRIQDVEFAIDQLVEIAVRALSPGINDPFTAIACLNQFGANLSDLAERSIPSGYYYDDEGKLRVISDAATFKGIVNRAFNQIRQHAKDDVAVTIRLLEVIAIIIARTSTAEQREPLLRQVEMIKTTSERVIEEQGDLNDILDRYKIIQRIVKGGDQHNTPVTEPEVTNTD